MSPKARKSHVLPQVLLELGLHGAHKRYPDGRRLTKEERAALPVMERINEGVTAAAARVAGAASSPDVAWLVAQFLDPVHLASQKTVKLPAHDLLHEAVARLEDLYAGVDVTSPRAKVRTEPRKKLAAALDDWVEAYRARSKDKRWADIEGTPVTLDQLRAWQARTQAIPVAVIPRLELPHEFEHALRMVESWDEVLRRRGHVGESFSLRAEVARLHNWPGDQWIDGDDYAKVQKRFHRRLRKAKKVSKDPVRDAIMRRALYLREGLLLDRVNPLEWFLAVCQFRWAVPEVFDIRPELMTWQLVDWVARLATPEEPLDTEIPEWAASSLDPRDVPADMLTAVSGPDLMIDLDEDVVTALPPGCRVRRLVVSARSPIGPDWTVYWVDSEWEDSRPILDLVESEKLHPEVVFVSDEQPLELADLIRPFLDRAYEIPTNPLTAHSHIPGVYPVLRDFPDAGL